MVPLLAFLAPPFWQRQLCKLRPTLELMEILLLEGLNLILELSVVLLWEVLLRVAVPYLALRLVAVLRRRLQRLGR